MVNVGIILLGTGILIYLIKEGLELRDKPTKLKYISFFIIFILLITSGVLQYYQESKKERYSRDSGTLSGKLKDKEIIYPEINWYGASVRFTSNDKNTNIFSIPLAIWIEDGRLKVSTTITDKENNIIAKLEANEWEVNTNTNSFFRRNFDDNALEIIDENENVVLQIQFDGKSIQLAGIWYKEDGSKVCIKPTKGGFVMASLDKNQTVDMDIDKLFKYPADLHPGERIR